jgi:Ni/Co efflux regulator RcnB
MIRRILPVLILSAFIAGPIATPATAADDKTANKCEKIKDMKLKAQCLRQSTQPRK